MGELVAAPVAVDLSRLPAPNVVQALSYEDILAEIVADFAARMPDYGAFLESDPAQKLLETCAYRIFIARAQVNDAARAVLVAYATGADLDNLAAFYGVERLVIAPATDTVDAVLESDDDLRTRITLAPELFPAVGRTSGGYRAIALRAAPTLADVAPLKGDGGRLALVLLGRDGDGSVPAETISIVQTALEQDDAAQLTDVVTVRSATIIPYAPVVNVLTRIGPDPNLIRSAVEAGIRSYAASRRKIGLRVYRQQLEAAASVGGVERATVDIGDVDTPIDGSAFLAGLTINVVTE